MAFQQGLSGLNTAAKALDAISNNVANGSTVGFKMSDLQFSDVFASAVSGGGGASQIGIGTAVSRVLQSFTQGNITTTNNPLDLAINGEGMFRMSGGGAISYTRNGQFILDKDGYIVNSNNQRLTGYLANSSGVIQATAPLDLQLDTSDQAPQVTSTVAFNINLDARESVPTNGTFSTSDPLSYNSSTSATVYDSQGYPHTLSLYYVKTSTANQWSLYRTLDGGSPTTASTVTFSGAGALSSTATISESFAITTGATSPLAFDVNYTGSTQYGNSFNVNRLTQDGYAAGRLSGVAVGTDGVILGRYSNGQSRNLAQAVLASFPSPSGLQALGSNQWGETADSGQAVIGAPNSGSYGAIQSSAVEDSNVDLTAELVRMITQQRNYQANAQSIRTQDQILQTLVNLR